MFCIWNTTADKLEPMFSNSNYHPKATVVENCVFASLGRGNWKSSSASLTETLNWSAYPWELVSNAYLEESAAHIGNGLTGKSEKVFCGDSVMDYAAIRCTSATELTEILNDS